MVEHLPNEERLRTQIADLEEHWNLCREKLAGLRDEHILAIHADEKLRLKQRVAETEKECQQLEQQLRDLEDQLPDPGMDDLDQPQQVPLHRPPRAAHFTDRKKDLAQILKDLQPGCTVTLCGPGGIGKTALAAEAVWQLAPANEPPRQFPDGIVFHSFYNQSDTNLALEAIARAFGEEPKPTPATAAQRALAGKRVLLILDGTEDADNLSRVLTVAGGCGLLITSRNIRDAVDERQDLRPLATEDAVQLLIDWAGKALDDDEAAQRICTLVGQLPLAIRLVGRYLQETGDRASEYLQWLEETPLKALDPDSQHHRLASIPWLLQRSLEQVDKPARNVLALVGQLAFAPFSAEVIEKALQLSINTWRRALRQLISYGLLLHRDERYEASHALIHTYARERLSMKAEVFERLVIYYTHLITEQSTLEAQGYERLDAEHNHIMQIMRNCVKRKAWREILKLIQVTREYFEYLDYRTKYFESQGYWTERRITVEWGLEAARKLADRTEEAHCIKALGDVHRMQGEYELARQCYEQALTISEVIGDRLGQANSIQALGDVHQRQSEYEPARQRYKQAQIIYTQTSHRMGEANCIRALGHIHRMRGEYELARQCYEQARAIYAQTDYRLGEANCIRVLGHIHRIQGKYELARQYYKLVQPIYAQIGHRLGEALSIFFLGEVHRMQCEYEPARQCYKQAQIIYTQIGHRLGEANCIRALGHIHRVQGEYELASQRYELARTIYETIGNRYNYAWNLAYLGLAYNGLKKVDQAHDCLEKAIAIFKEINLPNIIEDVRQWLYELDVQSSQ